MPADRNGCAAGIKWGKWAVGPLNMAFVPMCSGYTCFWVRGCHGCVASTAHQRAIAGSNPVVRAVAGVVHWWAKLARLG